ncbi:MAG: phospholipase D family protein [Sandaracinaceae bacterium]|nr:phospholipase D family protein [Sandaracinaceae bacterium]MBK8412675.1 phospholipase D family protein [Sandaracinaceae bacterium]
MQIETVTAPAGGMLAAVRSVLDHGDQALLCVAFAQTRGVHLVAKELERASARGSARVMVTTFGSTAPAALAAIQQTGADLRVLNPVGGTYHPKVYLGRTANSIQAVVGSVNLTSGLVANIEVATVMRGSIDDRPLADLWNWAETTWGHDRAAAWSGVIEPGLDEPIEPELLAMLAAVARENPRVYTLGPSAAENVVADVTASGLWVETARSRERSAGAQLVPPRMLNLAWDTLRARGRLSNREMLEELRIHRSSFVCAVLARLPGVTVEPGRSIVLRIRAHSTEA